MASHRPMHRLKCSLLALVFVACSAMPVRAEVDADWDEDGVADAVDACPSTEPSDIVGPDGCAICSCEGGPDGSGWSSRRDYMACVVSWVKTNRASGVVNARDGRVIMRKARNSTCGDSSLVRCCVYQPIDADVGRCRIMTEDACDALDDRLFDLDGGADIEDAGSCLPNPCIF